MKNIASQLEHIYTPKKGLVIYTSEQDNVYVEAYDMDATGHAINARPFTTDESIELASLMDCSPEMKRDYLRPRSVLLENLLYLNPSRDGFAIWFTPCHEAHLFFTPNLDIPSGKAMLPPMIWKADRNQLEIYAIQSLTKPTADTPLCYAPFFNVYADGRVCMGTVDIDIAEDCMLEEFIKAWEDYFFNSYFSHPLDNQALKTDLTTLWKTQLSSPQDFPLEILQPNKKQLKNLFYE